jgi:hypothetical protein
VRKPSTPAATVAAGNKLKRKIVTFLMGVISSGGAELELAGGVHARIKGIIRSDQGPYSIT